MPDEETFALNKKIEIKIRYKKDTRNLHYTLTVSVSIFFKIPSKHSLAWLEQIKSAEFISCIVQDLHKKTLNNSEQFQKENTLTQACRSSCSIA